MLGRSIVNAASKSSGYHWWASTLKQPGQRYLLTHRLSYQRLEIDKAPTLKAHHKAGHLVQGKAGTVAPKLEDEHQFGFARGAAYKSC